MISGSAPGPYPDEPTTDHYQAFNRFARGPVLVDLTGKAALIQRGGNTFREKLTFAAKAGSAVRGLQQHRRHDARLPGIHRFRQIPAGFISQNEGEALAASLWSTNAWMRSCAWRAWERRSPSPGPWCASTSASGSGAITHDAATSSHPGLARRNPKRFAASQLRLRSRPGGLDLLVDSFYESSVGTWRAEFSDESASIGEILGRN